MDICSGGNPCGVRLEPIGVASCNRGRPPSCGVVFEPKGVASCRRGGIGRPALGCPSLVPFTTGRAFGDGGMERPRAGLRGPRPPGTGARRSGTGDAMFGCGLEVPLAEKPGSIDSYVLARARLLSWLHSLQGPRCSRCYCSQDACCARGTAGSWLCRRSGTDPDSFKMEMFVGKRALHAGTVGSSGTVRCRQPRNADLLVQAKGGTGRCEAGGRAVVEKGLEDWAASDVWPRVQGRCGSQAAGATRGRVRLRDVGVQVAGQAMLTGKLQRALLSASAAWLADCFRMLDGLRGSQQLWRGEPARAEQGLPRKVKGTRTVSGSRVF